MISNHFFEFLRELELNNHKDWFDQNRQRYEQNVKKPFEEFVMELGYQIGKFDAEIQGDFKKNIFRINKDIRFSKDKSPYKTNRSAAFSLNGKKDHEDPGYYIELGANKCYIAGGAWSPSPEKLYKIRSEIYYQLDEFNSIIGESNFVKTYGKIEGEQAKKLPKDIAEWALDSDYIRHKQFYFWKEFSHQEVFSPKFVSIVAQWFQNGYSINQFLRRAMRD